MEDRFTKCPNPNCNAKFFPGDTTKTCPFCGAVRYQAWRPTTIAEYFEEERRRIKRPLLDASGNIDKQNLKRNSNHNTLVFVIVFTIWIIIVAGIIGIAKFIKSEYMAQEGRTELFLLGLFFCLFLTLWIISLCIADKVPELNNKDYMPMDENVDVCTYNGVGVALVGGRRSYYDFFVIGVPILPLGAYEAEMVSNYSKSYKKTITKYIVRGKVRWSGKDLLWIYCWYWKFVFLFATIITFFCL